MAYSFFPTGYQGYQMPQVNQQSNQFQNGSSSLIWVQGEEAAKSYLVAPNSTVVLWDTEGKTIYVKSADASGMPSLKTLDYEVRGDIGKSPEISTMEGFATKEDISVIQKEIESLKAKFQDKEAKKK